MPELHRFAIKITCKCTIVTTFNGSNSSSNVLKKVRILQSVNDPCITSLEDVIDTTNFLFIVLELAEGGELFYKIIEKTRPMLSCTSSKFPWPSSTCTSRRSVTGT